MPDTGLEKLNKKRLSVKFGYDKLDHIGDLSDVSSKGFFVESRTVYKPGVVLWCELTTRDRAIILIEGRVQSSKKRRSASEHYHEIVNGDLYPQVSTGRKRISNFALKREIDGMIQAEAPNCGIFKYMTSKSLTNLRGSGLAMLAI